MLKIRLTRTGRKNAPSYRIVIANRRDKRDGEAIAYIGIYNPTKKPVVLEVDKEAAKEWLAKGAQPTDTVKYLLAKAGVIAKPKQKESKVFKVKPGKKAQTRSGKKESDKTEKPDKPAKTKTADSAPTNE